MMRLAAMLAMLLVSGAAAADLYRWVEPETGSIKYSSYPPPWYGDPAKERRSPKVQVIPERSRAPSSGPRFDDEARPVPAVVPAAQQQTKPDPSATKEGPADGR